MYCELNASGIPLDLLNNLYAYATYTAFGVSALAAVKTYFISDGILFIIHMLTKMRKISKIINTLVFVLGFILIIVTGVYWQIKIKIEKDYLLANIFLMLV